MGFCSSHPAAGAAAPRAERLLRAERRRGKHAERPSRKHGANPQGASGRSRAPPGTRWSWAGNGHTARGAARKHPPLRHGEISDPTAGKGSAGRAVLGLKPPAAPAAEVAACLRAAAQMHIHLCDITRPVISHKCDYRRVSVLPARGNVTRGSTRPGLPHDSAQPSLSAVTRAWFIAPLPSPGALQMKPRSLLGTAVQLPWERPRGPRHLLPAVPGSPRGGLAARTARQHLKALQS